MMVLREMKGGWGCWSGKNFRGKLSLPSGSVRVEIF
jgi:hypothetical protein